jgi:Ca2+-binding RTX toxin-like protein
MTPTNVTPSVTAYPLGSRPSGADDTIFGGGGRDFAAGVGGNDVFFGGAGWDVFLGGAGNDVGFGGIGFDRLDGGAGHDSLEGNEGDDTLDGGTGADVMSGGAGWDVFHVDNADDRVEDVDDDPSDYRGSGEVHTSVSVYFGRGHGFFSIRETSISDLYLTGSEDLFAAGNRLRNTMYGNSGDNEMSGVGGSDVLHGGAGADFLTGGDGADTLDGGDGNDALYGELGRDSLTGGAGDDRLVGYTGTDTLDGGDGNDWLEGDPGADLLRGGAGDDVLIGQTWGEATPGHADTLRGGAGADELGGAGDDIFVFAAGESTPTTRDLVGRFQRPGAEPGDLFDVSLIDADTTTPGNQAFVLGTGNAKGHLWQVAENLGDVWVAVVLGNVDDDAAAEFAVAVDLGEGGIWQIYSEEDFIL